MYTIKHASEMLGVNVATLRAWERRYGIGAPQRTDAGYRLYDDDALRALGTMQALVQEGMAPRQAAEETRRRLDSEAPSAPPAPGGALDGAGPGDGAEEATERLLLAAERLDVAAVSRLLDQRFAHVALETVVDEWLMPAMRELGLAWASGRVTVAGEHMVAHAVVRKLSAAYEAAGADGIGPRVVVGLPPKNRHEIGLLGFAVAARRAGLATTYVGADLPVTDWLAAVEARRPVAVVLAASMTRDLGHLDSVVTALHDAHPNLLVAVGGGLQERTPESCLRLGHRVGEAARELSRRVAG
ncbi:MerR family transcriptional regulator [Nocardioides daphniae]|uniref:HTH-type transcriptional repressor CarH n=1 Tax=Nocardioides daphniae TaxID=402297 RepID=A0A4P7UA63_9ACTN|nr:MerR family transcriptional regulator [Nocardioides daphniae]QCC76491.1 MerR family transcriptional regulator [Nocardioides daphniae]GGD06192.1 HTH-type transcriptional repressor CarH [Nocardioides daphniae]